MRYFEVEKEVLAGELRAGRIYADGEFIDAPSDTEMRTVTTGYSVFEYNEDGTTEGVKFYGVNINTEDWETDEEKVLAKIKEDYAPEKGWQNNNW